MINTGEGNRLEDVCKLSHREKEILQLAARGKSNKEIANICCIKVTTVKTHFSNIGRKIEGQKKSSGGRFGNSLGITNPRFIFFKEIIE